MYNIIIQYILHYYNNTDNILFYMILYMYISHSGLRAQGWHVHVQYPSDVQGVTHYYMQWKLEYINPQLILLYLSCTVLASFPVLREGGGKAWYISL